jgi:hypothetical protein
MNNAACGLRRRRANSRKRGRHGIHRTRVGRYRNRIIYQGCRRIEPAPPTPPPLASRGSIITWILELQMGEDSGGEPIQRNPPASPPRRRIRSTRSRKTLILPPASISRSRRGCARTAIPALRAANPGESRPRRRRIPPARFPPRRRSAPAVSRRARTASWIGTAFRPEPAAAGSTASARAKSNPAASMVEPQPGSEKSVVRNSAGKGYAPARAISSNCSLLSRPR